MLLHSNQLSAKNLTFDVTLDGRLFIEARKRRRLRTVPWGTLDATGAVDVDHYSLRSTREETPDPNKQLVMNTNDEAWQAVAHAEYCQKF